MKGLDVELRTLRFHGLVTQRQDVQHADHVGAGLSGVGHIALHFLRADAVIDGLFARPFFGVQAGVHHQAAGTKKLAVQRAQKGVRIIDVPTLVDGQALCVQRPAFAVRAATAEDAALPPARQIGLFLLNRQLKVVARHGLVNRQAAHGRDVERRPR